MELRDVKGRVRQQHVERGQGGPGNEVLEVPPADHQQTDRDSEVAD